LRKLVVGTALRRAVVFVTVFSSLQLAWQASRSTLVQRLVVQDATVKTAAALANWLTPRIHAQAMGTTLEAPGGSINIANGCEGVEAFFMLVAAFAIAPIPWRSRLWGLLFGLPFIFVINEARILVLFHAFRANRELFDALHGLVTPIAVILLTSGYFYAWFASQVPQTAGR
jgi:exosortase/archaeosortase family protein